ncbi:non-canonical purine NTP pyrophosphatase [Xylanibacillus composti]|uniref:dITP/XTP pyrophosphatase n=1 Tax=Xylanibacillus composti TaxID=1572762 RepID=A0A8J4M2H7_9BACL|nr:non-canonical purine NTP pyrophosphatase [Xylanibacillus composti]MDT9723408.1 non-canonical purine NTP pyrophosphatase [Xylanibacillus composti]GIQ68556.1 non-canonical purine NTP pyrophosphatase [Xylanibacillus composti]
MPAVPNPVVIATRNAGKVKEFEAMLGKLGLEVQSLADYPAIPDIPEDGATFRDNAIIKARAVAERLNRAVIADDSGLCVDRLDGAPGVYSARFAGEQATDAENNAKLLRKLQELAPESAWPQGADAADGTSVELLSAARFVCVLALVVPGKEQPVTAEGNCEGFILGKSRGDGGFGYDPLFYLPQLGQSMAELSLEEKNRLSHRSQALKRFMELISH